MIITKTPFRMSFFGGGSDLPEFYRQFPGSTLSVTIDRYMYISSHAFFEQNQYRMKYSRTETVENILLLEHPILRAVIQRMKIAPGIEISSIADIPAGTGLGSSSSFTVGLLHNLYTYQSRFVGKEELARLACQIEIEDLGEPIGKQDQYAAAFGGLNLITYFPNERVSVEPIYLRADFYQDFQDHLLLFYTGKHRAASSVLLEQKNNMMAVEKVDQLKKMVEMVGLAREMLLEGQFDKFGYLMHENWKLKKTMASGISNTEIDRVYEIALSEGAWGGKILGAGGGGFLLLCCPPEKKQRVVSQLRHLGLEKKEFRFEQDGSKVIFAEQIPIQNEICSC